MMMLSRESRTESRASVYLQRQPSAGSAAGPIERLFARGAAGVSRVELDLPEPVRMEGDIR